LYLADEKNAIKNYQKNAKSAAARPRILQQEKRRGKMKKKILNRLILL